MDDIIEVLKRGDRLNPAQNERLLTFLKEQQGSPLANLAVAVAEEAVNQDSFCHVKIEGPDGKLAALGFAAADPSPELAQDLEALIDRYSA